MELDLTPRLGFLAAHQGKGPLSTYKREIVYLLIFTLNNYDN